jgi:hypothetical protein
MPEPRVPLGSPHIQPQPKSERPGRRWFIVAGISGLAAASIHVLRVLENQDTPQPTPSVPSAPHSQAPAQATDADKKALQERVNIFTSAMAEVLARDKTETQRRWSNTDIAVHRNIKNSLDMLLGNLAIDLNLTLDLSDFSYESRKTPVPARADDNTVLDIGKAWLDATSATLTRYFNGFKDDMLAKGTPPAQIDAILEATAHRVIRCLNIHSGIYLEGIDQIMPMIPKFLGPGSMPPRPAAPTTSAVPKGITL